MRGSPWACVFNPALRSHDMRCLDCHYSLKGLTEHRCPECGRAFDPNDSKTYGTGWRPKPWTISIAVFSGLVAFISSLILVIAMMRKPGDIDPFQLIGLTLVLWPLIFLAIRTLCTLALAIHMSRWR